MNDAITIAHERPDRPDVVRLIEALDAHAIALYPPESNHLLVLEPAPDREDRIALERSPHAVSRNSGWGSVRASSLRARRRLRAHCRGSGF